MQEKAKKESEKRMKSFQKLQKKAEKNASKENEKIEKRRASLYPQTAAGMPEGFSTDRRQSVGVTAFSSLTSGPSAGGGTVKYSDIMGTVASRKLKGTVFSRIQKKEKERSEDIFTVRDGYGTQRSLTGLKSGHQADIVFRDKGDTNMEDREEEDMARDSFVVEPSSIFNRPGFGSVAFRHSISAFNALSINGDVSCHWNLQFTSFSYLQILLRTKTRRTV